MPPRIEVAAGTTGNVSEGTEAKLGLVLTVYIVTWELMLYLMLDQYSRLSLWNQNFYILLFIMNSAQLRRRKL